MCLTALRAFALFIIGLNVGTLAYAAPGNDNCSGATPLTLNVTNTAGTVKSATASASIPVGCATGTPDDDVWYSFTLTSSRAVTTITLSNIGTNLVSSGARVQLFSGTCSALNSLQCGTTTITANNLASGTYYVRVYSFGNTAINNAANFEITVSASPDNDNCSTAALLTSNNNCVNTQDTLNLAASSGMANGCVASGTYYDVWYKFVAAGSTETITISNLNAGITSHDLQLYNGSCGALSALQCTTTNTLTASGLTSGATYYVRFSSIGINPNVNGTVYTLDICVTHPAPPPSNDDCAGATPLVVGASSTPGTVWGATASSSIPLGCATGTPDDDVWYKFTANGGSATISLNPVGTDLTTSGARMQLFSGSCGALTSVACGTTSITTLAVTAGTSYYVRVYSNGSGAIGTTAAGSTFSIAVTGPTTVTAPQTNEVFQQVTLSSTGGVLNDPWEVTYGSDGYLWITEGRGYKVYRMDPNTGVKTTVLDISQNSTFLPLADRTFNVQFASTQNPWPQGGMAGLALHPDFMDATTPKKYVYISYVHSFTGYVNGRSTDSLGVIFVNRIVRFTYNTTTAQLESPVSLCDTLPGSNDHNSQRMIIAPVNGVNYLFYAEGDMGAGQFANKYRLNKAQYTNSYEGKILRFNLESDNDASSALDKWIPNDNPFNGTSQSAIWSTGIRNNQGFAYAKINGVDLLYGSSHGPYSDDEINIIEGNRNYGHPLVVGYASDNNYNGSSVGATPYYTTLPAGANLIPIINSETTNASNIGASYKDPIFSIYAAPQATIKSTYLNNPPNSGWPSVGPSGMDIYTSSAIPGWKNSLLVAALKGGRVMRLKLNTAGTAIVTTDTANYFWSTNRFRDVALTPDGKTIFAIIDKSSTTSGPTSTTPMVSACAGCVLKYTFVGYKDNNNNRSTIPSTIPVTTGTANTCTSVPVVTINASNNNIWVPITGQDGNIMAEIRANGNNLGTISASFYTNSGTVRKNGSQKPFLDRNMTITPAVQPNTEVNIRLYITKSELDALIATTNSGVNFPTDLKIYKNSDVCGATIRSSGITISPDYVEAQGTGGYVIGARINSFSSFYFGGSGFTVLPLKLVDFKGTLQRNDAVLQWETANEQGTAYFAIERSIDGLSFEKAGEVNAAGDRSTNARYSYTDKGAALLTAEVLYYRLKSVDQDGKYSYSKIVALHVQRSMDVMVYPNPVKDKLTIRINNQDAKQITVQVSDVQGRIVYTNQQSLHPGTNNIVIDVRHWNPQLYIVKLMSDKAEVLVTQKFKKVD